MFNINLHYFVRKLIRDKWTSLIIVSGLAIGIAVCLLLTLYINNELSYDKHFRDYGHVYRITTVVKTGDELQHLAVSPKILGYILKEEYPEINEATYIFDSPLKYNIQYEDKLIIQEGIRLASPEIFNVFSYPFLAGNPGEALKNPGSIVLTKSLASKIFNNVQLAMGKKLILDDEIFAVTGILENLPKNSDPQFTALLPNPFKGNEDLLDMEGYTFIKSENADEKQLNHILENVITEKYQPLLQEQMQGVELQFTIQPLEELHFSEKLLADTPKGNKNNLYIFSLIALFVLIIASINHINLSMAMFSKKAFTMGVRKLSGARKGQLVRGNIFESCLITGISLILGIFIMVLMIPEMNLLTSKDIDPFDLLKPDIIIVIISIYLIINFVTGYLPSLVFNKKTTVQLITQSGMAFRKNFRKPLVTFQFIISIMMLSGFFVFYKQLNYMKNKDLGYNNKNIVALEVPVYDTSNFRKAGLLVRELKQYPDVYGVSAGEGGSYFGTNHRGMKMLFANEINGNYKQFVIHYIDVDEHFIDLADIKLLDGRSFDGNGSEDIYNDKIIINEAYARAMEMEAGLIGKTTPTGEKVIGLVQDFHFMPLQNKIEPACFRFRDKHPEHIFVKIDPANIHLVKSLWEKHMEGFPFIARPLADNYIKGYKNEEAGLRIINFFTLLSILTTCIGLLGLIRFISENKTKEIGIRKVNGAKVREIVRMLNSDFIMLILVAFLIASPVAWYFMNRWLQNFAYRTELSWWIFALAGIITLVIALLTVSWQSWRAARRNPVESLRYE